MNLSVQRRAEITLRSLSPSERKKVNNSLDELRLLTDTPSLPTGGLRKLKSVDLYRYPKGLRGLRKLKSVDLYSYPTGLKHRLRIILSKNDSGWVVEDIMDHDKYNRLGLEARLTQQV